MSIQFSPQRDKWLGTALVVTAGKGAMGVGMAVGEGRVDSAHSAQRGPNAYDALEKLTQSEKRAQKVLGDDKDMLIARTKQKRKPPEQTAFRSGTWRGFLCLQAHFSPQNSEHRSGIPPFAFFLIRLSESWVFGDLTG